MSRPAMNPTEARACEVCKHWRRKTQHKGDCLLSPWNVEYENPKTGVRQLVEYWTTGRYATCPRWELLSSVPSGTDSSEAMGFHLTNRFGG